MRKKWNETLLMIALKSKIKKNKNEKLEYEKNKKEIK